MLPGTVKIYPILDLDFVQRNDFDTTDILQLWQSLEIHFYQLRAKGSSPAEYLKSARRLKEQFPSLNLIANDFLELALDNRDIFNGIHLGQEDLRELSPDSRNSLQLATHSTSEEFLTGISTHNREQFTAALLQDNIRWSYLALGPMADTESKANISDPVISPEERELIFSYYNRHITARSSQIKSARLPEIVLIGGINRDTISEILPVDFTTKYQFLPWIASISAVNQKNSLIQLQNRLMKIT